MMKPLLEVQDADGLILGCAWHDDPDAGPTLPQYQPLPGTKFIDTPLAHGFTREGRSDTEAAYWRGGKIEWADTLSQARVAAWITVKRERDYAEAEPFEFEGDLYDASKENISGAALTALLAQLAGQEIADEWTLADNTRKTLSGPQIIALGLALTQRVKEIHARGRQLRDLIDNAATPAEAYGYTWNSLNA